MSFFKAVAIVVMTCVVKQSLARNSLAMLQHVRKHMHQHSFHVVQLDNRETDEVRTSVASLREFAQAISSPHSLFECASTVDKASVIAYTCDLAPADTIVLYFDTDVVWNGKSERYTKQYVQDVFLSHPETVIISGVDFLDTIQLNRMAKTKYTGVTNNGVLAVKCSDKEQNLSFLRAWRKLSTVLGSDQAALHLITLPGSVFARKHVFDSFLFGVYSDTFQHFPGAYKKRFPTDMESPQIDKHLRLPCPYTFLDTHSR